MDDGYRDRSKTLAELCLAHCLVSFQKGETILAKCARLIYDTMSLCVALASQLTTNSA